MKIFMMHSLVPGVRYYRTVLPGDEISKQFKHSIYCEDTSLEGLNQSEWQSKALDPNFHEVLEKLMKGVDLLAAQLIHTPSGLSVLMGIRNFYKIPLVVDCDDNVEDVPHYNRGAAAYRPNSELNMVTTALIRSADAVTVTTDHLKGILGKYNDKIYVLPNSLDFDLWEEDVKLPGKHNKQVRIGWMGAQTHEDDFRLFVPAMKEILGLHKNVHFYFVGGVPDCIHALDHKRIHAMNQWYDILHYPSQMRMWEFDIGVAPLRDNAFNRSKSNLRWLEYSAMGIPSVVSSVEPFNMSVKEGKTGLFAYEMDEWVAQMSRLVLDKELREKIGAAANKEVKEKFNIQKNAKLWDRAYKKVKREFRVEVNT